MCEKFFLEQIKLFIITFLSEYMATYQRKFVPDKTGKKHSKKYANSEDKGRGEQRVGLCSKAKKNERGNQEMDCRKKGCRK